VKRKQKASLKRGIIVASIVVFAVIVAFVALVFLTSPSGKLEVIFSKQFDTNIQEIKIDPQGTNYFLGTPDGNLIILSAGGEETAKLDVGSQVLEIVIEPKARIAVVRTLTKITGFTYDGKLVWEHKIQDYLPEKLQILPREKLGVYLRSGRGDEPMAALFDVETGKELSRTLIKVNETDINPTFMPDGESIVFEVVPGMVAEVGLTPDLPMFWQAHLDTYDGRFRNIEIEITHSNLVVCYFRLDEKRNTNESFRELYVFDATNIPEAESGTPEKDVFWKKRIDGDLSVVQVNSTNDNILVQAQSVEIFDRSGNLLASETTDSGFYFSSLGDSRYMSSFFLEDSSGSNISVLLFAKGIGREGVLWRRTETMSNFLLPVVDPKCERVLMVSPDQKEVMLLKLIP